MNVSIDASCLLVNPHSGLSEVVHNLLLNLPSIDSNINFTVYYNYFRKHRDGKFPQYQNTVINCLKVPRRVIDLLWKFDQLPFDKFLHRPDISHSLYFPVPPVKKAKIVLTIHDCRYFAVPQLYNNKEVKKYIRLMEMSLNRVDYITAVSAFTQKEILKYFSFPEERIEVIHNGFSQRTPNEKIWPKVEKWFKENGLDQPYLLYTGALDPRKNLNRLVDVVALCKGKRRDFPLLVIAGIPKRHWNNNPIAEKINRLGIDNSICVTGEVENEILPWLIKKAHASCYLSLYEGFGFPPLEAMSLGVPVIASNSSSIPEVTDSAACLVDPNSVDEIVKGLDKVIYNQNYRQKLIEAGYKQIKKFTWKNASEKYINLYKMIGGL